MDTEQDKLSLKWHHVLTNTCIPMLLVIAGYFLVGSIVRLVFNYWLPSSYFSFLMSAVCSGLPDTSTTYTMIFWSFLVLRIFEFTLLGLSMFGLMKFKKIGKNAWITMLIFKTASYWTACAVTLYYILMDNYTVERYIFSNLFSSKTYVSSDIARSVPILLFIVSAIAMTFFCIFNIKYYKARKELFVVEKKTTPAVAGAILQPVTEKAIPVVKEKKPRKPLFSQKPPVKEKKKEEVPPPLPAVKKEPEKEIIPEVKPAPPIEVKPAQVETPPAQINKIPPTVPSGEEKPANPWIDEPDAFSLNGESLMFCPFCGAKLRNTTSIYCEQCGKRIR